MVRGALSDDHRIQLKVVTGTFNAKKNRKKSWNLVLGHLGPARWPEHGAPNDIARPHCTRIIEEYKNQQNTASLPWLSLLLDLNPI